MHSIQNQSQVVYTVCYMAVWYDFVLGATVVHLIGQWESLLDPLCFTVHACDHSGKHRGASG